MHALKARLTHLRLTDEANLLGRWACRIDAIKAEALAGRSEINRTTQASLNKIRWSVRLVRATFDRFSFVFHFHRIPDLQEFATIITCLELKSNLEKTHGRRLSLHRFFFLLGLAALFVQASPEPALL